MDSVNSTCRPSEKPRRFMKGSSSRTESRTKPSRYSRICPGLPELPSRKKPAVLHASQGQYDTENSIEMASQPSSYATATKTRESTRRGEPGYDKAALDRRNQAAKGTLKPHQDLF